MGTAGRAQRAPSLVAEDRIFASEGEGVGYEFMRSHIHGFRPGPSLWTICREVRGSIIGAFGYTDFTGSSCLLHWAGVHRNWLTRDFLRKAFEVPFIQWDLEVMLGVIASGNTQSLRAARKLGFEEFAIVPRAHPDGALVFMRMYRENCRWLESPRRTHG